MTPRPKRVQLRRTKDWRKPEGAISVARPTIYGNPFRIGFTYCGPTIRAAMDREEAVAAFRDWIARDTLDPLFWDRDLIVAHVRLKAALLRGDLSGRDLACWCPLNEPCHADVLLELANGGAR